MLFSLGVPHTPIVVPPEVFPECDAALQSYGVGRYNYCNMILFADKEIGRTIDTLKQNNLWSNTVIIFSTDNGGRPNTTSIGNYVWDGFDSNLPLRGQKASPWEAGTRGIGFINCGYLEQYGIGGTVNNKLYHVVDWYKSIIYGIAGINYNDPSLGVIDSMNIWQSVLNEDVLSPRNEWVYSSNFGAAPTGIRQNEGN